MNDRPTIKSIALTTVIGFNLRMKLQVGEVLPLDRNDMYQMIKTSEGSNGQPGLFFLFIFVLYKPHSNSDRRSRKRAC